MAPKAKSKIVNLADVSKEKLADAKIEVTAIANCIIRFSDGTCAIVGSQEVKSVNDAKLEQFVAASSIQEVMAAAHSTGLEQIMLDARNKAFGESYAETVCNLCNDLATPPEAAAVTKGGKKKKKIRAKPFREVKVESLLGISISFKSIKRAFAAELNSREIVRSASFRNLLLKASANSQSFAKGLELLNEALFRIENPIALMTLNDIISREGAYINQAEEKLAEEILGNFGFDSDCKLVDPSRLPEILGDQPPAEALKRSELSKALQDALVLEDGMCVRNDIFCRPASESLEVLEDSVLVCVDGVLTKQQKEHRKTPANEDGSTVGDLARAGRSSSWPKHEKKSCAGSANKEDKRFLSNYCAYIHVPNKGTICLVAADLGALYKKILACLLYGGLLKGRKLVFIADGAKDLNDHTKSVFSFVDHKLILDWHHLAKKIYSCLSSGAAGTAKAKEEFCQRIKDCLWIGDLWSARLLLKQCLNYPSNEELAQMPENEREILQHQLKGILKCKNPKAIEKALTYLDNKSNMIACYRLRAAYGLRNSSNSVEKVNDLLVSRRQKHNGTSWTRFGSTGLALVTALVLNGHLDQWVLSRKVSFELPPLRHSAAAQMEVANQGVESLEAI